MTSVESGQSQADNVWMKIQEAIVGRPKELTDAERAELLAKGYRPVEMWVPDVDSDLFWERLRAEGTAIRESDRRSEMDKVLEAFLEDLWDDLA